MTVLLYLYYPLLDSHLAGGAQMGVRLLLRELARRGVRIRVLCPEIGESTFPAEPGITVWPVLREVDSMPSWPTDMAHNLRVLEQGLADVDVVWTVDRAVPLPVSQPVVLSLMAFCYPREIEALFSRTWDTIIVPSSYAARIVHTLVGGLGSQHDARQLHMINIPVDTCGPDRTPPTVVGNAHMHTPRLVLFPHRPEPEKGHFLALDVLECLLRTSGQYRLLIPRPPVARNADAKPEAEFIVAVESQVEKMGLGSRVTFHPWVPYTGLASYFASGSCCLHLSRLPETFGLSVVQAITFGCPVVSLGAGALTEIVPPGMGQTVVASLDASQIAEAVRNPPSLDEVRRGQDLIRDRFHPGRIAESYLKVFSETRSSTPCIRDERANEKALRIAPWYRLLANGELVHDFGFHVVDLTKEERDVIAGAIGSGGEVDPGTDVQVVQSLAAKGILLGHPGGTAGSRFF